MASLKLRDAVGLPAIALLSLALLAGCSGRGSRPAPAGDTTGVGTSVSLDSTRSPVVDTMAKQDTSQAAAADTGVKAAVSAADTAASRAAAKSRSGQARRDTTRVQKAESTKSAAAPAPAPTPRQQDTSKAMGQAQDTSRAQDTAQQQTAEAPLRDAYHQAPHDTVSADVYEGWKQFNLNCARCHGEDVLGTTIAPHLIMSLKPDGPINTKELFVQTVCAGRPEKGMPAWCALGMEIPTIDKVYLYVHGRSEGKIGPGRPARKSEG
jgi:mono/diheme cytochrome c family protein